MTINERMREVRQALGLSQAALAERLNITQPAINKVEQQLGGVSERNIRAMVTMFGVNETWLRAGEGEMFMDRKARAVEDLRTKYQLSEEEAAIIAAALTAEPKDRRRIFEGLSAIGKWLNK